MGGAKKKTTGGKKKDRNGTALGEENVRDRKNYRKKGKLLDFY